MAYRRARLLAQQLARDDQLLDLARALVDAQRAHLAVEALDRRRRAPRRGRRGAAPRGRRSAARPRWRRAWPSRPRSVIARRAARRRRAGRVAHQQRAPRRARRHVGERDLRAPGSSASGLPNCLRAFDVRERLVERARAPCRTAAAPTVAGRRRACASASSKPVALLAEPRAAGTRSPSKRERADRVRRDQLHRLGTRQPGASARRPRRPRARGAARRRCARTRVDVGDAARWR